jgi:addiction module RelE/StbE family toxin
MEMKIYYTEEFKRDVKKIKDRLVQERIKKLILKIKDNPECGKPLSHGLAGLRSIRLPPFRIIYEIKADTIILWKFEHREKVYGA